MWKFVILLTFATSLAFVAAHPDFCAGCTTNLVGDRLKDAEKELNLSLTKLAAGTGPNYKLGKVNSASSQVVSGVMYRINADLIDGNSKTKTCDIRIHSQAWLENGIEVTFECPGEEKVIKRHSA